MRNLKVSFFPATLMLVALLLCGCAGRREAIALSNATIAGSEIHQDADAIIYDGLSSSLGRQFELLFRAKRAELETIRQKFLAKGYEKFDGIFAVHMKSLDQDLKEAESEDYQQAHQKLLDAAQAYKTDHSDAKAKALHDAIEAFRKETEEFSKFRSDSIRQEIEARNTFLQQWQRTVETSCQDALSEIQKIETESATMFEKLDSSLAKLRTHHKAILNGERQLGEYLKQKTAIRIVLEQFLHGVGLDVSLGSVDNWIHKTAATVEGHLNTRVESLNKKLEGEAARP